MTLAENGQAALDLFARHSCDAVILDIRMPGMSGIEVLRRLKDLDPAVEVILLTAFESLESVREALSQGACN